MRKLTYVLGFILSFAFVACTSSVKEQTEDAQTAVEGVIEDVQDELLEEEIIEEEIVEEELFEEEDYDYEEEEEIAE